MGKTWIVYLALALHLGCAGDGFGQQLSEAQTCVLRNARSLIGVKEVGKNTGPMVDVIIRKSGGTPPAMWCGYSQIYIFKVMCRIKEVANGWAASWFPKNRIVSLKEAQPGDHAGISYSNKGIQHVTMVESFGPGKTFVVTLEGNYQDGFCRVTRPAAKIKAFARWWAPKNEKPIANNRVSNP